MESKAVFILFRSSSVKMDNPRMTYKVLESICHEQAKIGPATTAEKRSTVKVAATNVAQCQTFDYKGHTFEMSK